MADEAKNGGGGGSRVDRGVRPRLLPEENFRWGLPEGHVGHVDNETALRAMCDHGAARFHEGYCDLVNFDCMQYEVSFIQSYMAERHPSVAYSIGNPRWALARAVAEWEASEGPNVGGVAHAPR